MTLQRRTIHVLTNNWHQGGLRLGLAAGLLFLCLPVAPTWSQTNFWIGEGEDKLWSTPENWSNGVPATGRTIVVNGPEAQGSRGPVIEDGIGALAGTLTSDFGTAKMTMNGGTLDVSKDIRWGESIEARATFEMNDGVVNVNNGKLTLGIQSSREPPRGAKGTWEMNGGVLNAEEIKMSDVGRGIAEIELLGGTINVGSGGLEMSREADIEVADGMMVLDGDQQDLLNGYIDDGWIKATGDRTLLVAFAGGKTTLSATSPFEPGDYNENGELDAGDLDLQAAAFKTQDLDFDLNTDGVVDIKDRESWVHDLKKTWMGDSNLDSEFNSGDLVNVFAAGKYETGEMASWAQGDWDGDMAFGSGDLVVAFADGGYEQGPPAVAAVPEPSSLLLIGMALCGLSIAGRRSRSRR